MLNRAGNRTVARHSMPTEPTDSVIRPGGEHERAAVSKRKQGISRCARRIAQGRTGACRQSKIPGSQTPHSPSGRAVEGRLRLRMGERRKSGEKREILRAVRGQEYPPALLVHVRPELGQALPFLYFAGRRI